MTDISIPKELLPHNCVLNRYKDDGVFGQGELADSVTLSNVRCSVTHSKKASARGGRLEKSGVLYFDCVNSLPEDVVFLKDGFRSEVVFRGEAFAVTGVRLIYGSSVLHHLEVVLGG